MHLLLWNLRKMFAGGSDIIACFMGGTWALSVHCGEIQCPLLGCDIEAWDEQGIITFMTFQVN